MKSNHPKLKKSKKIVNGILALVLTSSILLLSDLSNRKREVVREEGTISRSDFHAQEGRKYKIGLTYFGPDKTFDLTEKGLFDGLRDLGFMRDSNLTVIAQHANGEMANLQPIHLNMDNLDIDLVVVTSTPGITAAISAVKKRPIVFTMSYTPLEAGAGKSYTDHLSNITGVGSFPPVEKTMDFICDVIPGTRRIGTLYNSSEVNSVKVVSQAREYLKSKGIELIETTVTNTSEVFQAVSALSMRSIDALWITGDNTALQAFHGIVRVSRDNRIPLIINDNEFVKDGALAAIGVSWYDTGLRSAEYVARVLNGENPAHIPIENFVLEEITLNHEVAAELGVTIPDQYLNFSLQKLKGQSYKFCLVHYIDSPNSENAEHGIRDELKRRGLEEGPDFTLKVFNAQGDVSTLNSISDAVVSDPWDLIFVTSTPTIQALSKKVRHAPIVFTNVGDPVRAGLGESYEKHQQNLTGISTMSDFEGMVALVKEAIPGIKTIGTIFTPGEINAVAYKEELEKAAEKRGLELIAVPSNTATEVVDAALSIVNRGIDAFTQISDNLTASCGSSIIKVAYDTKTPYFAFIGDQLEQGAIAAVSRDYYYAGVDAVDMAVRVLDGQNPGEIPFQLVSKSTVKVNPDAEKYFNIRIPEKFLKQ
jgi:ABC-type uncharacterized transport system substrate-binding protein